MGNHEFYQTTVNVALQQIQEFAERMNQRPGNRFILLHRRRYGVNSTITILGCTLWSHILPEQASEVQMRLTDFNEWRGIRNRSMEDYNIDHQIDLDWLNDQVKQIEAEEPQRTIIIATHHSPTTDVRATDTQHVGSSISFGFATDLSLESCWKSPLLSCGHSGTHIPASSIVTT